MRILIFECHPDNGRFLADYFRSLDYQAIWTEKGDQALEHCRYFQPNIIILDLRVTGIGSAPLLESLKHLPNYSQIAVICISAEFHQQQVDWVKSSGATFLAKPFSNDEIAKLAQSLCLHRNQSEEVFADANQDQACQAQIKILARI
jgi:DNA-binding response OmpR family regulator